MLLLHAVELLHTCQTFELGKQLLVQILNPKRWSTTSTWPAFHLHSTCGSSFALCTRYYSRLRIIHIQLSQPLPPFIPVTPRAHTVSIRGCAKDVWQFLTDIAEHGLPRCRLAAVVLAVQEASDQSHCPRPSGPAIGMVQLPCRGRELQNSASHDEFTSQLPSYFFHGIPHHIPVSQ